MIKKITYIADDKCYIFECPHCNHYIQVFENEINCQIFRHAVLKLNMEQINQHSSKEYCDKVVEDNLVYGCAKPFRIFQENGLWAYAEVCNYI